MTTQNKLISSIHVTLEELDFLQQLFQSDLGITIRTVEIVASLKTKVMFPRPYHYDIGMEDNGTS